MSEEYMEDIVISVPGASVTEEGKGIERVLLKLSGEALAGEKKTGFDDATIMEVARQVKLLTDNGIQVGVVIGGGNFWRGRTSETIERTKADQIGMLATVMNSIYTSEIFRYAGMKTRVMTPFLCGSFTELYSKDGVLQAFERGEVVFFAGGTGHPYFSTDMGAALRAVEIKADIILAARAVDGVYDSDPKLNPEAKKFDTLPMKEVVEKQLGVMDLAAAVLCMENKMPMKVFGLQETDSIIHAVKGTTNGTVLTV